MSGSAIVMMLVALLLVWGGLGLSLAHLRRNPDESAGFLTPEPRHD